MINRDIYLAECLDEIASKYTVYTPGEGIIITPNPASEDNYSISIDPEYTTNMPTYSFDTKTMNVVTEGHDKTVSVKISTVDEYQSLTADENGIYANLDYMLSSTSALSSESVYSATYTSGFTYTYMTANLPYEVVSSIPSTATSGIIYVIG